MKSSKPVVEFDKITHDKLYDVFIKQEKDGYDWRMEFVKAYVDGNYAKVDKLANGTTYTFNKFVLDSMLEQFTLSDDGFSKMLISAKHFGSGFIKDINYDKDKVEIKTQQGDINCRKLSSVMPEIENILPYINTPNRAGMCHAYSVRFALNFNLESDLVTGYVAPLSKKNKNLHTWVEFKFCGEDMVIDFTRGLMFNKDGYYLLKNIDGPVQKIPRNTVIVDLFMYSQLSKIDPLLTKLYFANRNQAVKEYQKHTGDGMNNGETIFFK